MRQFQARSAAFRPGAVLAFKPVIGITSGNSGGKSVFSVSTARRRAATTADDSEDVRGTVERFNGRYGVAAAWFGRDTTEPSTASPSPAGCSGVIERLAARRSA
jgi:hypothetical protein